MHILTCSSTEKREICDALVIPFWKGENGAEAAVDIEQFKELVLLPIIAGDFEGKEDESISVWGKGPAEKRLILIGLGEKKKVSSEQLRKSWSQLIRTCQQRKIKSINILTPKFDVLPQELAVKALIEGLFLGSYVFDALKNESLKEKPTSRVETVTLITSEIHLTEEIARKVEKVMTAVWLARDLVNGNADDITPQYFAELAIDLSKSYPRIQAEVHSRDWIEEQGMGLLLAVARGSFRDPVFICMHYNGNPATHDRTVLIGKGITYDTGGLNLKPTGSMEDMRSDMAGAAVCFATIQAIASLGLPINVSIVVPSCENAIGSKAFKPGDVYKSFSGRTVEIGNTDAEGRLVLADALAYTVKELKPSRIIDLATLTGAIIIALGNELIGLFSNSDFLAEELVHSGQKTFERLWRMPLYDEYKERLKSDIADIKNVAGRAGGAILGAIFLQEFAGKTPWAHLDIAGTAYLSEANKYLPKYATGVGVRLLVDYLETLSRKEWYSVS